MSLKASKVAFNIAMNLDPEIIRKSSIKYPKDLGSWGLDEKKIDELKRHLSKMKAEIKVFDLDEKEFPTLKDKNLLEVEVKTDSASARKITDILKRTGAFPLEKFHITNLKKEKTQVVNKASGELTYQLPRPQGVRLES